MLFTESPFIKAPRAISLKQVVDFATYNLYTLYLFTASDFKTIVVPNTLFGILGPLSGQFYPYQVSLASRDGILRAAASLFWVWVNLLPLDISNQISGDSIEEDGINKPWRPLPSKRLSIATASQIQNVGRVLALLVSIGIGGVVPCIGIYFFGYWYNELHGSDSWLTRNLLNSAGYMCFVIGATEVFASSSVIYCTPTAQCWILLVGLVIFTTIQSQDLPDQFGDAQKGRKTLPLTLGDRPTRYSVLAALVAWSAFAPYFWSLPVIVYMFVMFMALLVGIRFVLQTTVKADKLSFKLWNVWVICIYILPALKTLTA